MAKASEGVEIRIDVVGENTKELWKGVFKVRPRLSHRLEIEKDRKRRELLGKEPGTPGQAALVYATVMSELSVRLSDWPKWWPEVGFGLDLEDESPLIALQEEVKKIVEANAAEVQKAGIDAQEALRAKVAARGDLDDDLTKK